MQTLFLGTRWYEGQHYNTPQDDSYDEPTKAHRNASRKVQIERQFQHHQVQPPVLYRARLNATRNRAFYPMDGNLRKPQGDMSLEILDKFQFPTP